MVLRQPLETGPIQDCEDDELLQKNKEYRYTPEKMTWDPNCYECKVRYRDPKAKDLVMYLHAWRYKVRSDDEMMLVTDEMFRDQTDSLRRGCRPGLRRPGSSRARR